ncbi:leucine-rich repeat domain-containing protein [Alienimonas sp. DA493]|uniref:leucine-rich repeat domain-containing protein n=1 Tax=Alienimonas sp. DA493 TaxID=3373605 RepID=UPI0037548A5E
MPLAALLAAALFAPQESESADAAAVPPLTDADRAAIAAVEALGGQVVQLAQNDARLDVSFHLGDVKLTAKHLDALVPLADRLRELNLRGTPFDDDLSHKLTLLPNLRKLHLENTRITDAALVPVGTLEKLEYLNLYGTDVSDAGLKNLRGLVALRTLYVWDTRVTPDGALALLEDLPEAEIVGVDLSPEPREPLVAPKPTADTPTEEKEE